MLSAVVLFAHMPKPGLITLDVNARPLKEVVTALGQQMGKDLLVSPTIENEIFVLHLENADPEEVMKRLAKAAYGEWAPEQGDKLRLVADKIARQNASRKALEKRTADFDKALKELDKANNFGDFGFIAGGGATTTVAVEAAAPAAQGDQPPLQKYIKELMKIVPARTYAIMGDGDRVVLSSAPTHTQVPLPPRAKALLDQLVIEHNKYAARHAKEAEDDAKEQQLEAQNQGLPDEFMNRFRQQNQALKEPPVKALLVLSRGGLMSMIMGQDGVQAQLKLYNKAGETVLSGSGAVNVGAGGGMVEIIRENMPGNTAKKPEPPKGNKLKYSELSTKFQKSMNAMEMMESGPQIDPKLKEALLTPDKIDPLSYIWGEGFIQSAQLSKTNLIAQVPDDMESGMFFMMKAPATDAELAEKAKLSGEWTQADGWTEYRPLDPVGNDSVRVYRSDLAKLLNAVTSRTVPALDDLAAYSLRNGPVMSTQVVMPYVRLAPALVQSGMSGMLDWNVLRFYATLNAAQKTQIFDKGSISLGGLSTAQKAIAQRIMFGPNARYTNDAASQKKDDGDMWGMVEVFLGGNAGKTYKDEPTELMPSGLPPQGAVAGRGKTDYMAMPMGKDGKPTNMYGAMGTDEIAMMKWMSGQKGFEQAAAFMPSMDNLLLGNRRTFEFRFYAAPDTFVEAKLLDDSIDSSSKPTNFDNLPQEWRKRIAARMEKMKDSPLQFAVGAPGGRVGP